MYNCLQLSVAGITLTEHCARFERGQTVGLWVGQNILFELHDIQFAQNVRILTHTLLNKLRCTPIYKALCLLNAAMPAKHVTFVAYLFTYTPYLFISPSIPINNKLFRNLPMPMSFTLTDTQAVSALQLHRQPFLQ
jgi:hypothetical protein